jgi:hypothetical protein
LAAHATDPNIRASYLDLANRFRDMANVASLDNAKRSESAKLAEGMVGKSSGPH